MQNAAHFFSPPLGKSLNTIEKNEGLRSVDTSFARRDSPRPLKNKLAMSPSSTGTGHGGQYDTKYSLVGYILRAAFVEESFFIVLNQPVHVYNLNLNFADFP